MWTPSVAAPGAGGAAQSAAPPARSAGRNLRAPVLRRFQAPDKDVSPRGACWGRSPVRMECRTLLGF
eukprot:2603095-Alexandrium_andersonii.AAC.1